MEIEAKYRTGLRMIIAISGALILVITIHGLMSGSEWLSTAILGRIPLGNVAVAASLLALALFNLLYLARSRINKVIGLGLVAIAISWYPTGIIWSGNLKLNFVNNGDLWLPYSYTVAAVCIISVLLNLLLRAHYALKPKSAK